MVEAAINENPDVQAFARNYGAAFPVGTVGNMQALDFMQISPMVRSFVPFMAFIDRTGTIRAQYTGSDSEFLNTNPAIQTQNIKNEAEKLLAEPEPRAKPAARRKTSSKSATP